MAFTKVGKTHLQDGAVSDSHVASNAAIQTSKLEDNLNFIFNDGSRAFTAPISGTIPTVGSHLTTKDYVDSKVGTAIAVSLSPLSINSEGVLSSLAKADHTHEITGFASDTHEHLASSITYDPLLTGSLFESTNFQGVVDEISEIHKLTNEPSGFVNRTDSVLSFNDATRTFTIAPTGTEYVMFVRGRKHVISTPQSIDIPDVHGANHFYFDIDGNLQRSSTFPSNMLFQQAYVCNVYWNLAGQYALFVADERHGVTMDGGTHYYLHSTAGSQYVSGLGVTPIGLDADGNLATSAKIAVANGVICDEDIVFSITSGSPETLSPVAQIPVWYRIGAGNGNWSRKAADDYPLIHATAGVVYTNINGLPPINRFNPATSEWELTEVENPNNFICIHILATTSIIAPIFALQGTEAYPTATAAGSGASEEIDAILSTSSLPAGELLLLYSLIFECSATMSNTPKARLVSINAETPYINYIGAKYSKNLVSNNHSILRGLTHDDHLQYAKTVGATRATFNVNAPSNGQTLMYSGGQWVNTSQGEAAVPIIKQIVSGMIPFASGTNVIPYDDTIPATTEGAQILSVAVNSSDITSTFIINFSFVAEISSNSKILTASVFRDSTLVGVSTQFFPSSGKPGIMAMTLHDTPGSTGQVIYTIRIGADTSSTWKINKDDATAGAFGSDVLKHNGFTIMEY